MLSGLEMLDSLEQFNQGQRSLGEPEFRIGVGINYGTVTVGNIGTEKKMDYTVIGDMVNVASRLEGLTKRYHQPLLITEMLKEKIDGAVANRIVDSVAVKGRRGGIRIYAVRKDPSEREERAIRLHNDSMELYYTRSFQEAARGFREVRRAAAGRFPGGACLSSAASAWPPILPLPTGMAWRSWKRSSASQR